MNRRTIASQALLQFICLTVLRNSKLSASNLTRTWNADAQLSTGLESMNEPMKSFFAL